MFFASDNGGPAHPKVMERVMAENAGHKMPYGNDATTEEVQERLRTLFEAPDAAVYLVATGTAANAIALASYTQPYQTVYCTPMAHITRDECGAPEFYTGGGKLSHVGHADKMSAAELGAAIQGTAQGVVHQVQRGPVSITQVTEFGGVYSLEEIEALTACARDFGCPVHMDGARFANAVAATNLSPAQMSWQAGVDILCFGGTKNGCLGVEAVIFFDPEKAWEFELRRKRGGHLFSKNRFLAAQMAAYVTDDLWLDMARAANEKAARLATGLLAHGAELKNSVDANMIFASLPRRTHQFLQDQGAQYYVSGGPLATGEADEHLQARFVCDWSLPDDQIERFISLLETQNA